MRPDDALGTRPQRRGLATTAGRWAVALGAVAATGLGIFLLYFLIYRARGFSLPLGWDTPWYVWRADFVAHEGLGSVGTASRPGHPLLTAVLMPATGLTALELQVVLPFVLLGAFALALGAVVTDALGGGMTRWLAVASVAGVVLGATRLAGENVANLLNLMLAVVALAFLARRVAGDRGFLAAVVLLVASGLAHWLFLGVVAAVLVAWMLLALPRSRREAGAGTAAWRTETGILAAFGAAAGASMLAVIYPVLGSSWRTIELMEERRRYLPKLGEDLRAVVAPVTGPLAAAGGAALWRAPGPGDGSRAGARGPFLRMTLAWAVVCLLGTLVAAATLAVQPHRFFTLLVAFPGILGLAGAVWWIAARLPRVPALGRAALAAIAVLALAVPGLRWWYGTDEAGAGPRQWFDAAAFEEARRAAVYTATLPPEEPLVFLTSPVGASGAISVPLMERTIRAGLPAGQQERVHVFPGEPNDLLAGRRTLVGNEAVDEQNLDYWLDVEPVLDRDATVLILERLAPQQAGEARDRFDAVQISPGVLLLRGQPPPISLPVPDPLAPVPRLARGLFRAGVLFAVLGLAGLGWSLGLLGRRAEPIVAIGLAPALGCAALMLGGLVAAKAGVTLAGPGGIVTLIAAGGLGWAYAAWRALPAFRAPEVERGPPR